MFVCKNHDSQVTSLTDKSEGLGSGNKKYSLSIT